MQTLNHPDVATGLVRVPGHRGRRLPRTGSGRALLPGAIFDTFAAINIEPDRFIESGDSVVVPETTLRSAGEMASKQSRRRHPGLRVRSGRLARLRLYQETHEALEAVGLSGKYARCRLLSRGELARFICAAVGRGDFSSAEWAHPEIEFVIADFGPLVGSTKGLAGMAETWRTFLGAWEGSLQLEVDEGSEPVPTSAAPRSRGSLSGRTKQRGLAELRAVGAMTPPQPSPERRPCDRRCQGRLTTNGCAKGRAESRGLPPRRLAAGR